MNQENHYAEVTGGCNPITELPSPGNFGTFFRMAGWAEMSEIKLNFIL